MGICWLVHSNYFDLSCLLDNCAMFGIPRMGGGKKKVQGKRAFVETGELESVFTKNGGIGICCNDIDLQWRVETYI